LAEIDRDAARGLVLERDAEAAKAEAARRLMAVAERQSPAQQKSGMAVRFGSLAALFFVPALALGLYSRVGSPNLPDSPLEARLKARPGNLDVMAAVTKVEAHLQQNPDDGRGYEVLAPIYLRIGRVEDSLRAYASALRLLGENADLRSAYAEAMVFAADGTVTPEAQKSFEMALSTNPALVKPHFYLGLAAEQAGDKLRAKEIWSELLANAPDGAPWAVPLRQRLAALGDEDNTSEDKTGDKAAAVVAMPEAERNATIHAMVDGLAARLTQNGQDLEGWLRLIRAYRVLQEDAKARTALSDARRNLAGDATAMGRIEALARELGLGG